VTDENTFTPSDPTGSIDTIDADAALSSIEGGEIAPAQDSPPVGETKEPAGAERSPAPQAPLEFEFTAGGKPIKVPATDPRVKQWLAQGHDYAQRMAEFKQSQAKWEAERGELEKKYAPYRDVDTFIQQNPEWWSHVQQAWQARQAQAEARAPQAAADPNNPLTQELETLKQQLAELSQFKQSFETEKQAQARQAEDAKLKEEIQSIRTQFKDLDWDTPDESGYSLELRVLKHAADNGIQNFRAAFRDYNHEHIVKLAEERAKEAVAKENQRRTKLGLLGASPTPKKSAAPEVENIKQKSWDQLEREALEELRGA